MWWETDGDDPLLARENDLIGLTATVPVVRGVGRLRGPGPPELLVVLDDRLDPRRSGRWRGQRADRWAERAYDWFGPVPGIHLPLSSLAGRSRRADPATRFVRRFGMTGQELSRYRTPELGAVLDRLGDDLRYLFLPPIVAAGPSRTRSAGSSELGPGTTGTPLLIDGRACWLTAGHVVPGAAATVECFRRAGLASRVVRAGPVCCLADPREQPGVPGLDYAVFSAAGPDPASPAPRPHLQPGQSLTPAVQCLVHVGTRSRPRLVHFTNIELTVSAETAGAHRMWKALWLMEARRSAGKPGDSGCRVETLGGVLAGHLVGVTRASGFGGYRICLVQDAYTTLDDLRQRFGHQVDYIDTGEEA